MHMKRLAPLLLLLQLLQANCSGALADGPGKASRYDRGKVQASLAKLEKPGLVIGELALARDAVVDGDTIKVQGLRTTLRLTAIDTEETYKNERDRRDSEKDFAAFQKARRGTSMRPVKTATPMGEEAKEWAKKWFADVKRVRLERDHPKELRGLYNRYLTYVLAKKNGVWRNYNIECVRAGMSPYFTKYSYSRRFHDEFVQAQKEARAHKRGIWSAGKKHYPDYDERLAWWNARADFIRAFEKKAKDSPNHIVLTHWDSMLRLEASEGKEVKLLAAIDRINLGDRGPTRVLLSRRRMSSFPLIFFDKDTFGATNLSHHQREFITVKGFVSRYFNKYKKQHELQIVVTLPGQIDTSQVPGIDSRKSTKE